MSTCGRQSAWGLHWCSRGCTGTGADLPLVLRACPLSHCHPNTLPCVVVGAGKRPASSDVQAMAQSVPDPLTTRVISTGLPVKLQACRLRQTYGL